MPYQPTYPSPYMETIDVAQEGGNVFKCLINPKDTVTGAKINVFYDGKQLDVEVCSGEVAGYLSGTDTSTYIPIPYESSIYVDLKNRLENGEDLKVYHNYGVDIIVGITTFVHYGDTYIKLKKNSSSSPLPNTSYTIYSNVIKTFELDSYLFPFKGGMSDESWLQLTVDSTDLFNGAEYNWNVVLTISDHRTILFGNQVESVSETLDRLTVTGNTITTLGDIEFLNSEIERGVEYYLSIQGENIKISQFVSQSTGQQEQIGFYLDAPLSSKPTGNIWFEIYAASSIIVSPPYYFKARKTPVITFDVPATIETSVYDFSATYEQEQHVGIAYYEFNLYSGGDLIDSSGHIFSQDIKYNCGNLVNGKDYSIELTVVTDDGVEVREERPFSVSYEEAYADGSTTINVDNHNECIFVDYSNVEFSVDTSYQNAIKGYVIQRYEQDYGKLYPVCNIDKDCTSFFDYNVRNHKTYRYKITPIFVISYMVTKVIDGKTVHIQKTREVFGTPVNTSAIKTDWDGWSIIGLKSTSKFNEYTVDEDNIWVFEYNANGDPIKPVFNKAYATGFGQYPKEIRGQENYLEGSVSGLIGSISCNGEYINDDIDAIERWQAFCNDGNMKLLKDPKGYVIPCSIKDTTPTINYNVLEQITNISFNFVQLADRDDISVYGLEV